MAEGCAVLLGTQLGRLLVVASRAVPIQKYFDSEFRRHGSVHFRRGERWATMALAFAAR
jgi:hypothetical protein